MLYYKKKNEVFSPESIYKIEISCLLACQNLCL